MNILITGGFGFLGSTLVDIILEHKPDANIHIVDNLSSNAVNPVVFGSKRPITYSLENVADYVAGKTGRFDKIYHLASIVGPAGVLPHASSIVKEIVDDAYDITRFAKKQGARLLFVSTSEVYGGGQKGLCREDMPLVIGTEPSARLEYALGKLGAEVAMLNSHADVVIVRPFNIAGQRQSAKGGFVLPRFLKLAQDNNPLTIFGDGRQVRAFTDVRDVAKGTYLAMDKGLSGEVYNIGAWENKVTINELAERVIDLTNSTGGIEYIDPKHIFGPSYAEANDKFPDATKAIQHLFWQHEYDLDDIINSAIKDRESK